MEGYNYQVKKAASGAKNSAGLLRSRAKPPPLGKKLPRTWVETRSTLRGGVDSTPTTKTDMSGRLYHAAAHSPVLDSFPQLTPARYSPLKQVQNIIKIKEKECILMTVTSGGSPLVNPPLRFLMPSIDIRIDGQLNVLIQKTPPRDNADGRFPSSTSFRDKPCPFFT